MSAATATMSFGERAKLWGVAVRAYSFPASIVPIVLGSAYAWYKNDDPSWRFNWVLLLLTLVAGVLYHVAVNLINDYYDFQKGVDRPGTFGGSGVLVAGTMTPRQVANGAYLCIVIGTLIGLFFVWRLSTLGGGPYQVGWPILLIGIIGLLGVLWYTSNSGSAKYNALGNPLVFLMFGPGYVLGTYVIQAQPVSAGELWHPLLISIPIGFLVAAILHANDTRDIADDREAGIKTIAILQGKDRARAFYSFELFAPYVLVSLYVVGSMFTPEDRILPLTGFLPLLTLPLAMQLHKLFATVRDERSEALMPSVENTAKLHMAFGMLLSIGVIAGALWLR
jgi:1,4-dihydroxy-2-naphthoate octaprenyltransferase